MNYVSLQDQLILDEFTGDLINAQTGEIVKAEYESIPYRHEDTPYVANPKLPQDCKSKAELKAWVKENGIDRRTLVTSDDLLAIYKEDAAQSRMNGTQLHFKKYQYKAMSKLVKIIDFRNIIIDTRANIAKALGVDKSNLIRDLNKLKGFLTYETEGMKKGEIKIEIAPMYGFRHQSPRGRSWNVNFAKEKSTENHIGFNYKDSPLFDILKDGITLDEQFGPKAELPEDFMMGHISDNHSDDLFSDKFGDR